MSKLSAITRPNGKIYRPRKIQTITSGNEDEVTEIIVFGTHDVQFATNEAHHHAADHLAKYRTKLAITSGGRKYWYGTEIGGSNEDGKMLVFFTKNEEKGRACVKFDVEEIDPA